MRAGYKQIEVREELKNNFKSAAAAKGLALGVALELAMNEWLLKYGFPMCKPGKLDSDNR